jgi:hypothetical protein
MKKKKEKIFGRNKTKKEKCELMRKEEKLDKN